MAMTNFRDLCTAANDVRAGFQFEFYCELTGDSWRSPFEPYRRGQLTALVSRATQFFHQLHTASRVAGMASDGGFRNAKAAALAHAQELAAQRFRQCPQCNRWVSFDAFDEGSGMCNGCVKLKRSSNYGSAYREEPEAQSAGPVCANCQTPSQGGRFCHECGFDMASTHKSCPGCGATLPRQARFCGDCGHGF
jgi:hypothetical protein